MGFFIYLAYIKLSDYLRRARLTAASLWLFCFFVIPAYGLGTQPMVAIHDSELTRALETMPASGLTPTGSGTTGKQWWINNWHYFVMPDSIKEALRSDGTAFQVVGDSNILGGQLLDGNGQPQYPIVISLASEAISDAEIAQFTNYVAAGGFLFVGSSAFTRDPNGVSRGDFAFASQMGVHMVNTSMQNWWLSTTFTKVVNHRLVSDVPVGTLNWYMPLADDEICWGISPSHTINTSHLIWQVAPSDATVVANGSFNGNSYPYLLVKPFGKGCFIYVAAMQPLMGHGGNDPGMYAYMIFREAIAWAFQSAKLSVPKVSPWPYPYDAAVMFRHDEEDYPALINTIEASAQFENSVTNSFGQSAKGDYYFCTGILRTGYLPQDQTNEIASLRRAVTLYGATIGSHNGGFSNPNNPLLTNGLYSPPSYSNNYYDYWHWGPDEALDVTNPPPPGFSSGMAYAYASISNSFSDIATWGLTNGAGNHWFVSPSFNACRDGSKQILNELGVSASGDEKLTPFPSRVFSTQTPDQSYSYINLPVSDWYVGADVAQSLEDGGHTPQTMNAAVDYYYNLGGLINLYSHSSSAGGYSPGGWPEGWLEQLYVLYSMSKPRVWAANSPGIQSWWTTRSAVSIKPAATQNGNHLVTTMAVAGASDPNAAVEVYAVSANYTGLQVFTNGVQAGLSSYRSVGQTIRVLVGTSVTNVQVSYAIMPDAQNDAYYVQPGNTLTVTAPGVLANDSSGFGANLTAVLVTGPTNGNLILNSNGSFTYTPTNSQTTDVFTYLANDGQTNSAAAVVNITIMNLPVITNQPASLTNAAGTSASFTVGSTSSVPVSYTWYKNGTNQLADGGIISGSGTATLTIASVSNVNVGAYTVVVANPVGSVISSPPATLTVTGQLDPNLTGPPMGFVQNGGSTVELSVIATGTSPFACQWYYNSQPIPGAAAASVVLTGVTNSGGTYSVIVSNSFGTVTGTVTTLQPMASGAIFNDNFVRGTDPGPISPWVAALGDWTVTGQTLVSTNLSSNLAEAYLDGTNWGDYSVQATVRFPTSGSAGAYGGGIGGHLNPATGARYAAWIYPEGSPGGSAALKLVKFYDWQNWSGTPMQLSPTVLPNGVGTNWHTLNLTFRLNEIIAYWDGVKVADVTDNNFSGLAPYWSGGITADLWAGAAAQAMIVSNVVVSDFPVTILNQPVSMATNAGTTVNFNVTASGTAPLTCQWLKNGVALTDGGNVTGSSTTNLTLANVSGTDQASYQVVVVNPFGGLSSSNATLALIGPPVISGQPVSVSAQVGQTVSFTVFAGGSSLYYQWFKNTNAISGATAPTLLLTNVAYSDAANYSVIVTNVYGSATSSIATLTVQSCTPPPSGLVGWWPGDGNANDIFSTNHGTLQGGATATNAGLVGQCFSFDGTNGYVQIPDSPSLRPTNLTVEAWVKFSSLDSSHTANAGHQYIVFKQNPLSSNFEGYGLGKDRAPNGVVTNLAGDVFYFNVTSADGSNTAEVDSTVLVATNVWYHVAGVRGPNFLQLYVNGQLQGQVSVNFPQSYGNLPVFFGTSGESYWDGKLAGQLDEVSIYSRALDSNEIAAIYNAGAGGKCKSSPIVGNPPVITNQPAGMVVVVSNNAEFTVGVSGDAPLNYQWYFNGTNAVGLNTNVLALNAVTSANAGSYSVIITNVSGSVTSAPAVLTVVYPPEITNQPVGLVVGVGSPANFSVGAGGTAPLAYQWYFNGTNAVGLNTNSLTVASVQATNVGNYTVVITNAYGAVTSTPALLAVANPPVITNQPASLAVIVSNNAVFMVGVSGAAPLNYQWYFNGTNAVGLNTNVLALNAVTSANAGNYSVIVTNGSGSVTSAVAVLTVEYPPVITNQPVGLAVGLGSPANFSVGAGGTAPLAYQWWFNGTNAVGLDTNSLTLASVQATNVGNYTVVITNAYGAVTSTPALLTVANPPVITNQPAGLVVVVSNHAVFTVGVSGDAPLSYQWYFNATNAVGLNTNALALNAVTSANAGSYSVIVTNASGSVTSAPALLTVVYPPVITNQPASIGVIVSNSASFTVGVSGDLPISYQWWFNGTNAVGLNTNVLTLANVQGTNAGNYSVIVTNGSGSVTSAPALLTVEYPPVITNQPASLAVIVSNSASFTVGVTGDVPMSYQWWFNGTNAVGLNTNVLTLVNVQLTNAGIYSVIVTNASGSVTSSPATLTVSVPPTITTQPQGLTLLVGATAGFTVTATGTPPPVYQWLLNGTNISSATTNSLVLTNLQTTNSGIYSVLVTNLAGSVLSSNATLFVMATPPNISAGFNVSANTIGLTFATQTGPNYYLQFEDSLTATNWQTLTNVAGTGGPITLNLPTGVPTMRYFRLLVQ